MYRYAFVLLSLFFIACGSSKKSVVEIIFHDGFITEKHERGTRVIVEGFQIDLPLGYWAKDVHDWRYVDPYGRAHVDFFGYFVTEGANDSTELEFSLSQSTPLIVGVDKNDKEFFRTQAQINGDLVVNAFKDFGTYRWFSIYKRVKNSDLVFSMSGYRLDKKQYEIAHDIFDSFRRLDEDKK
ncbi:hypothetical protein HY967_00375 [Candidatus Jorgensenbacteria bacterium]|nr:hypothetical protein [Candidatus Jorgensenbacteria bacterium]